MQVDILKKKTEINMQICRYVDAWDGIKNEIKAVNEGEENNYGKDYKKIKFNFNDDLPLNKPLTFHGMTIIIRSVFEKVVNVIHKFFRWRFVWIIKILQYEKNSVSEGITLIKQVLKMLDLNLNFCFGFKFVINAMMF